MTYGRVLSARAAPDPVRRCEEGNSSHGTDEEVAAALGAGLTAVATAAVLSAIAPPDRAFAEGRVLGAGDPGSVSGSYIVTLTSGTRAPSAAGADIAEQYGARISHTYGTALNGFAVRVDERRARRLAADPRVASVVQDTRVALEGTRTYPPSWGLDRIDQRNRPLDGRYTPSGPAGAGVTAYVIDTGIRITHRDFGGRASYGWDFVDGDRTARDGNGHGTHVAATVVGRRYGVAKKARVVAVRVLDDRGRAPRLRSSPGSTGSPGTPGSRPWPTSVSTGTATPSWTRPSATPSPPA